MDLYMVDVVLVTDSDKSYDGAYPLFETRKKAELWLENRGYSGDKPAIEIVTV